MIGLVSEAGKESGYGLKVILDTLGLPIMPVEAASAPGVPIVVLHAPLDTPVDLGDFVTGGGFVLHILSSDCESFDPECLKWLDVGDRALPMLGVCCDPGEASGAPHYRFSFPEEVAGRIESKGKGTRITFGFDPGLSAYWLLTLAEEAQGPRDVCGRFPMEQSLLHKLDVLDVPVVNRYGDFLERILKQALASLGLPFVRKGYWPHGAEWAVALTHDVDVLRGGTRAEKAAARSEVRGCMKKGKLLMGLRKGLDSYHDSRMGDKAHQHWNLADIANAEKDLGFPSTFFVSGLSVEQASRDADIGLEMEYSPAEEDVSELFRSLIQAGAVIGLHGSYNSFPGEGLTEEKKRLEAALDGTVDGVRQHYLRFRAPETWEHQARAGFRWDSSIGWSHGLGFRAAFCHPYLLPQGLWELPFCALDTVLHDHMCLDDEGETDAYLKVAETVRKNRGLFVGIWHNHLVDIGKEGEPLLRAARRLKALHPHQTTPGEATKWYDARMRLSLASHESEGARQSFVLRSGATLSGMTLELESPGENVNSYKVLVRGAEVSTTRRGPTQLVPLPDLSAGGEVELTIIPK